MHTAALFMITKRWQLPRCPNVHQLTKSLTSWGRCKHNEPVLRHEANVAFTYHKTNELPIYRAE